MSTPGPWTRLRRAVTLALVAVACVAGPLGCGDNGRDINWDLAADRSIRAVGWKGTEEGFSIRHVRRVRIRIPGGLVIDERNPRFVVVGRHEDQVSGVVVQMSVGVTAETAHRQAKAMAQRYFGEVGGLDGWLAEVRPGEREMDRARDHSYAGVSNHVVNPTPDNPEVSVNVEFTGSLEAPWDVDIKVKFLPLA